MKLNFEAEYAPYKDNSGYGVKASVQRGSDVEPATFTIECWQVSVEHWPAVKEGIDRMVAAATADLSAVVTPGERPTSSGDQ